MKKLSTIASFGAIFLAAGLSSSVLASEEKVYEITITNLTYSQSFTPALIAVHRGRSDLFELGNEASPELAALAEGGDTSGIQTSLENRFHVLELTTVDDLIPPGHSVTVTVPAEDGANRFSLVSMMIPTNDSFIALDGVPLPKGFRAVERFIPGYDAGSEPNDESCANIPGPVCGGVGGSPNEGGEGFVHISRGIHGIADLQADVYDWRNSVARVVIQRKRGE